MQNDHEEIDYEVGQEQLDAVDRMLEELDMDEQFDRERLEQQQEQQHHLSARNGPNGGSNSSYALSGVNGYHHNNNDTTNTSSSSSANGGDQDMQGYAMQTSDDEEMDHRQEKQDSDEDEIDREPFGYIPLDQGDFTSMDNDDDENEEGDEDSNETLGYDQMDSDNENEDSQNEEGGTEQGYDGYLRRRNRDGTVPVPVIPAAVQIDLSALNDADDDDIINEDGTVAATRRAEMAAERIPEEDLKTIAMVMNSFTLPAPDWAQSIPEDRWLPRIVQRVEAEASGAVVASSGGISSDTSTSITPTAAERFDITETAAAPSVLATATTNAATNIHNSN
ncbi:hypothetical protein BGZ96_001218 [Linnemannia gamsii]|uniref:Uncharacterized protein n=1 Tax=Linnemannia gamsii TaxID=64522 RepID=A0ABQ7KFL1_9FUNG|nr:hypothetical protein BGZ96_001218 [Linnemannia gamsii]